MKIDRIELFHVAMPLLTPWRTAYGEDSVVESVLCRMSSGSVSAWGESCPLASPTYSPEWAGGVYETVVRWHAPRIIGQEIESGKQVQDLLSIYKGNPFAKALLDNTWWSLKSKLEDKPLHKLLGATRDSVPVGDDFGVRDTLDDLLALVSNSVQAGYPRVKLKYRPGWDLPMLKRVRKEFPEAVFHIDCNSGYTLQDIEMFKEIDSLNLAMIEQPLAYDDLHEHAQLQALIKTPVCLDESINSVRRARQAIELGSCQYINIKPARVGGLTNAIEIHDICQEAGIPCWVGGMLESAVGVGHCIALGMLDNFTYPADIFPTETYYAEDLCSSPITISRDSNGTPSVDALTKPHEPDEQRLRSCTLQSTTLRP